MKKCPSCDKTFEDSMRFCQVDGTPLVDDAPPLDPYKTIVARPIDLAASEPASPPAAPASPAFQASMPAIEEPEDLLHLPVADPLKTMYVSDEEMRKAMGGGGNSGDLQMEIPPMPAPEPPKFSEPEIPAPPFGDLTPASSSAPQREHAEIGTASPAIPSPFDDAPARPSFTEPVQPEPAYNEPATMIQDFPPASPFGSSESAFTPPPPTYQPTTSPAEPAFKEPEPYRPAPVATTQQDNSPAAWTPPPAPDAGWQNQEIGQNTPFQPPAAGGGVNQTLPIISLVLGIMSLCCYVSPVTGIAALITGYLGLKNIKKDPVNFGGKNLAIAGMVTGGIFLLVGLAYWIYIIFVVGIVALGNLGR
ncbi:MAG: DUF4190 domain-containing protein [Acidobacteriota bacterium]